MSRYFLMFISQVIINELWFLSVQKFFWFAMSLLNFPKSLNILVTMLSVQLLKWYTGRSSLTWLAAIGELFFTHSSTILTTARRILGSGDFSIRDVRMTWMKFFLISILMTDSRVFTRSRLSITNSLVTVRIECTVTECTVRNTNHNTITNNFLLYLSLVFDDFLND